MPLPTPNLDDRRFQDILDEARRLIPRYCPEWTDHNLSDPGITLLELFAWMTDLLLYRLNQVPDLNYIKFLELMGLRLEPPRASVAELLFRLTTPVTTEVVIPQGTVVGTLRTETAPAITFATDYDLVLRAPQFRHLLVTRDDIRFNDYLPELKEANRPGIFDDPPRPKHRMYLGFENDLSAHTLALRLDCTREGINVNPENPPLAWEAWDPVENDWFGIAKESDTTRGLNQPGEIILTLPLRAGEREVDGNGGFWLRCSVIPTVPGQSAFRRSPRLTGIAVDSLGGTVQASHASEITGEELGSTDGTPGQRAHLQTPPVLPCRPDETLEVQDEKGEFKSWKRVDDFGGSSSADCHFTLDPVSGTVELGPLIRTPSGVEHQYGQIPPAGRRMRYARYRNGGGVVGNVGARTLNVMQSPVPYVASVTNPLPAAGGTDAESIEHARWRGPRILRTSDRAVTAEDFEVLACAASPAVARANCLAVRDGADSSTPPGRVRVQLVPAITAGVGPVPEPQLFVSTQVERVVKQYLDDRRLICCELAVERPIYIHVSVVARLHIRPEFNATRVADEALEGLYRYVHPTTGGPDGHGWPFERPLFVSEVYSLLQRIPGVDMVEHAGLYQVDPRTGDRGDELSRVTPGSDGLLCSHEHRISLV